MLNRLKSFVTPSITPSSSTPPSPTRRSTDLPHTVLEPLPLPKQDQLDALRAKDIPLSKCTGCDGEGHEEYDGPELPRKFDVDLTSDMLGSSKPMHRLALISTSKHDWPHDICDDTSSLAFHLASVHQRKGVAALPNLGGLSLGKGDKGEKKEKIEGIYETKEENKLTVLASSVQVDHEEEGTTTALVFPDFKFISSVPISKSGANDLYTQSLDPTVGRVPPPASSTTSPPTQKSWALPYKAVIMLCSHKARDKRCSIAAPLLESVLSQTLTLHGHTVDTIGSSLDPTMLASLSSGAESEADAEEIVKNSTADSKEVGIFKISHLGGHRYSGVMIIALPTGAMLYYGRVRPRDCVAIVEETILGGKVLPQHLRSGGNLSREKGKTLLDW